MKVLHLDHVGIAVENLDESLKFWRDVLGLESLEPEIVDEQKVKVGFLPCGDAEIELLESTSPDGPIARFIEKKGPGIQHLAFRVDDIKEGIKYMEDHGLRMIDKEPRYGAGGATIAFMHPKSSDGILVELTERKK